MLDGKNALAIHCDLSVCCGEGLLTVTETIPKFNPSDDNQAFMSRAKALFCGFQLGDTIKILTESGARSYVLTAFVNSMGSFSAGSDVMEVVVPITSNDSINGVLAALKNEQDLSGVCREIEANSRGLSAQPLYDEVTASRRQTSIQTLLSVALLLVVAIAFYLISSISVLLVNYRIPVLGTFRSLGATKAETDLVLLGENGLYGLISAIIALPLGEALRTALRIYYWGVVPTAPRLSYLLLVPLFTVGMSVFVAVFSLLRTTKIPLRQLLFQKQNNAPAGSMPLFITGIVLTVASVVLSVQNRQYLISLLIVQLLLGVVGMGMMVPTLCVIFSRILETLAAGSRNGPVWLGIKNMGTNRINQATAFLIASVMSLVVVVFICISSISSFFDQYRYNYPYEVMIKGVSEDAASLSSIENVEGVESVVYEYWDYSNPELNGQKVRTCFAAVDGFSNGIEMDASWKYALNDGTCLVDYAYASIQDISLGDTITYRRSGSDSTFF